MTKQRVILSPEKFVQLLVVGLFWEHPERTAYRTPKGHIAFRTPLTTCHHILKMFRDMGAITDEQIAMVQSKKNGTLHQRFLFRHAGFLLGGRELSNASSLILIHDQNGLDGKPVNLVHCVVDKKIELSVLGSEKAKKYEPYFAGLGYSKELYLATVKTFNEQFKTEASSASASQMYRRRIASVKEAEG